MDRELTRQPVTGLPEFDGWHIVELTTPRAPRRPVLLHRTRTILVRNAWEDFYLPQLLAKMRADGVLRILEASWDACDRLGLDFTTLHIPAGGTE